METQLKLLCLLIINNAVLGMQYVVDSELGDDSNSGTGTSEAFRTIQRCVEQLKVSQQGDECRIRAGRYHEVVDINGLNGTSDKPFIIGGYGDERPIWDGTVPIQPESWDFDEGTGICSASIQDDIFALLLNDDLLTPARWPNALWSDKTIFNNSYWGHCDTNSSYGHILDDGYAGLAESGIDATGAMAILNIGSWFTYVRPVLSHKSGSPEFTYNHDMGEVPWNEKHNQYYLEAGLSLLDAAEEWVYDNTTKMIYFIPKDGICPDPQSTNLRGRTIDYGLIITNTTGIIIANMTFLAANINAYSEGGPTGQIDEIHLDSLDFKFPSSSHRMLGSTDQPKYTRLIALAWSHNVKVRGHISVVNCTFEGSEGSALVHEGIGNYIHNNLFAYNVFIGQWYGSEVSGGGTIKSRGIEEVFSQNTLWYNGGSEGVRPGANCTVKFNHITGHCAGSNQNDGSAIQVVRTYQNGAKISHNWIHDSPKLGVRFDTPIPLGDHEMGTGGYAGHNVIWDAHIGYSLNIKGDDHTVENNLVLDRNEGDLCTLCVIHRIWYDPTIFNNHTTTINNAASQADGGKNTDDYPNDWPLAGEVVENNYSGKDVRVHIVDPDNWDFRPVLGGAFTQGDEIIGPYLPEKEDKIYWIPGRKFFQTSTPVPVSGGTTSSTRDVVMFLGGYLADKHHFYFGKDESIVGGANMDDEEFQYSLVDEEGNIFSLPKLEEGSQYFWRVDVQRGGNIYHGDTWNFHT